MRTDAEKIAHLRATLAEVSSIAKNGAERRGMNASTMRAHDLKAIEALAYAALASNGPEITEAPCNCASCRMKRGEEPPA